MPFDLAERFISAAEEKLGARLPHSYRLAMMASNGGQVAACDDVWELHPILDSSISARLETRPLSARNRLGSVRRPNRIR